MKLSGCPRLLLCLALAISALICICAHAEEICGQSELELFTAGDLPEQQLVQTYAADSLSDYLFNQMTARKTSIDLRAYQLLPDDLVAALSDVINSEPSLFYVGTHVEYYISSTTGYITRYLPEYLYTGDDLDRRIAAFNSAIDSIASWASSATTDLGKLLMVNDYFCTHFRYDTDLTIYSPDLLFSEKTGVCQAYMMGYAAVLDKLGIANTHATSSAMSHTWNMVLLDGSWYHIDVTWNDPLPDRPLRSNHSTFLLSDSGISAASHYDWMSSVIAESTIYDDAFWRSIRTPLAVTGNSIYHITDVNADGMQTIMRRNMADGSAAEIHSFSIAGENGDTPELDHCAAICADSETVYYAARGQFYALPLDGGEPLLMYTTGSDELFLLSSILENGVITAVAAQSSDQSGVCCTFPCDSVLGLHVEPLLEMSTGDAAQLSASLIPAPIVAPQLTWSSSDPAIVSVDDNGQVSAVSPGFATIRVQGSGYDASCLVAVHSGEILRLPANIVTVDEEAFRSTSVQDVILPDGLRSIASRAFADCAQLNLVSIPESVAFIADDAFSGSENTVLLCPEGSYAAEYALSQSIPFYPY